MLSCIKSISSNLNIARTSTPLYVLSNEVHPLSPTPQGGMPSTISDASKMRPDSDASRKTTLRILAACIASAIPARNTAKYRQPGTFLPYPSNAATAAANAATGQAEEMPHDKNPQSSPIARVAGSARRHMIRALR